MANTLTKKIKRTVHRVTSIPDAMKIRSYREIQGFLSPREAVSLYQIATRLPENATIVEIGSWKGKSTYCLARGLGSGRVIAIDPFNCHGDVESSKRYESEKGETPLIEQFRANMRSRGVLEKIELWQGTSQDFAGKLTGIDMLFIDGDHSINGCDFDYTHFAPALKSGGYLLFHDFDKTRLDLGPTWVVNNRVRPSDAFEFVALFDTLWTARKR